MISRGQKSIKYLLQSENSTGNRKRFIYGSFWNLVGALASRGFTMVAAIITARLLGTTGYGELGIINSTVGMFSTFAGLGLGVTCTRYVAEFRMEHPQRAGKIIGLSNLVGLFTGLLMALILVILSPWLASHTLSAPHLAQELKIASILLITETLCGVYRGSLVGFEAFRSIARVGIVQGLSAFPIMLAGVYYFGLRGAVLALVINSIIGLCLTIVAIKKVTRVSSVKITYAGCFTERGVIWELSIPSALSGIMVGPIIWIGNTLVVNIPNGYASLGLFNAANQWQGLLNFLPGVIGGVLLPMIASQVQTNHRLEAVNILSSWVLVTIIALPIIAFPEFIALLYGTKYTVTSFYQSLAIMMLVSCILAYKEGIARKLITNNLMWWGFLSNLVWGVFFITAVVLLKEYGSLGLSISYLVSYTVNTLIFIPFYITRGVIPKYLIISKEVIFVWAVILLQVLATALQSSILLRLLLFALSVLILVYSFSSIWQMSAVKQTNTR